MLSNTKLKGATSSENSYIQAVGCIVIEIYCKESLISINDQTAGHMKFMETASNKLTNFKKDWFTIVAFPAFETNLTVIYERQKTSL